MSQTDLDVANGSGAVVRADINAHLDALVTNSSGATAPSPTFPNQWWMDTSTNILKQRDNANTAWVNTASKTGTDWVPYRNGTVLGPWAIKDPVVRVETGAYTVVAADDGKVVDGDATTAAFTVTLPTVAIAGNGFLISVKKTDSSTNAVTVDGDGAETIDGVATFVLSIQNDTVTLRCDGSNWLVVANAAGATKEFFVLVAADGTNFPYNQSLLDYAFSDLNSGAISKFVFDVPNDFTSLIDAAIPVLPDTTETLQWDITTDFGANGESLTANSDSVTDDTLAVVVSVFSELDVSPGLTGIAAGDHIGMFFISNTSNIRLLYLRIRYN